MPPLLPPSLPAVSFPPTDASWGPGGVLERVDRRLCRCLQTIPLGEAAAPQSPWGLPCLLLGALSPLRPAGPSAAVPSDSKGPAKGWEPPAWGLRPLWRYCASSPPFHVVTWQP